MTPWDEWWGMSPKDESNPQIALGSWYCFFFVKTRFHVLLFKFSFATYVVLLPCP
jgi:hypothetical protein